MDKQERDYQRHRIFEWLYELIGLSEEVRNDWLTYVLVIVGILLFSYICVLFVG